VRKYDAVSFLSDEHRDNYGRYIGAPLSDDLARHFHLDDTDRALIARKRGDHNRLGFAVQLGTVRYLGTFLEDPMAVPDAVLYTLSKQLLIEPRKDAAVYGSGEQRWLHATEIRSVYGYVEITEQKVAFRLTRWLYALCWTGNDRPSVLFERAAAWLVMHKVCCRLTRRWNATSPASAAGWSRGCGVRLLTVSMFNNRLGSKRC
jgi:hypothetical protein